MPDMTVQYDAAGLRVVKDVDGVKNYYIYEAGGNVMAI